MIVGLRKVVLSYLYNEKKFIKLVVVNISKIVKVKNKKMEEEYKRLLDSKDINEIKDGRDKLIIELIESKNKSKAEIEKIDERIENLYKKIVELSRDKRKLEKEYSTQKR